MANHPRLCTRIKKAALYRYPESRTDRWNLIGIVTRRVMQIHFTDEWLRIMREGDERFEHHSRPSTRIARVAWDITMALQDKRVRTKFKGGALATR